MLNGPRHVAANKQRGRGGRTAPHRNQFMIGMAICCSMRRDHIRVTAFSSALLPKSDTPANDMGGGSAVAPDVTVILLHPLYLK